MEENGYFRLKQALAALKRGYETGDFQEFFPYLADSCEFDTAWRRLPVTGKNAVMAYFSKKGKSISETGTFPVCRYVVQTDETEIKTHAMFAWEGKTAPVTQFRISHEKGKYALLLSQTLDGKTDTVYVDMNLDGAGNVRRILLLDTLFFRYADADS